MFTAIWFEDWRKVQQLIDKGAYVNAKMPVGKNYYQETPLFLAIFKENLLIVKLLVNSGANINAKDNDKTPLDFAKEHGHKEIIKYLESKVNK